MKWARKVATLIPALLGLLWWRWLRVMCPIKLAAIGQMTNTISNTMRCVWMMTMLTHPQWWWHMMTHDDTWWHRAVWWRRAAWWWATNPLGASPTSSVPSSLIRSSMCIIIIITISTQVSKKWLHNSLPPSSSSSSLTTNHNTHQAQTEEDIDFMLQEIDALGCDL